jgi:hypothetical protein
MHEPGMPINQPAFRNANIIANNGLIGEPDEQPNGTLGDSWPTFYAWTAPRAPRAQQWLCYRRLRSGHGVPVFECKGVLGFRHRTAECYVAAEPLLLGLRVGQAFVEGSFAVRGRCFLRVSFLCVDATSRSSALLCVSLIFAQLVSIPGSSPGLLVDEGRSAAPHSRLLAAFHQAAHLNRQRKLSRCNLQAHGR